MRLKDQLVLGLVGIVAIITLCFIGGSFVIINPGERGVVVRWGKVSDKVMEEGLNWKTPFVDDVDRMNVQLQKYEAPLMDASSKDMQKVQTAITVTYKLNPVGVVGVRRELGTSNDHEKYKQQVIKPQLEESIKAITANYKADELLAQRTAVRQEMQALLQQKLDNVLLNGFSIVEFAITNFNFSDSFEASIEAKVEAEQSAMRTENEVRQAKAEAQKQLAKAEGEAEAVKMRAKADAESVKMRAEAEAEAIRLRAAAFRDNPDVLKLDFVRTWDGRLPLVVSDSQPQFMFGIGNIASVKSDTETSPETGRRLETRR